MTFRPGVAVTRFMQRWDGLARSLPPKRKLLALLIFGLVLYGGFIALDHLVLRDWITETAGPPIDLEYYQNRTSQILDGKIPYKDFTTESPPLIMYLMLPPQIAGGSMIAYQIYFSLWAIMGGMMLYAGLRRFDDEKAFAVGIVYMTMPYALIEFTLGVQDDSISFLFFFLPLVLVLAGRIGASAIASTLGFWTKMFNALVIPWIILWEKDVRKRNRFLMILALLGLVVALPFLIVAPEQFISFPLYYFLNSEGAETGGSGQSPWHFLDLGGFGLPGAVGLAMTLIAIFGSTYLAWKWKLKFWQGCALVVFAFFLFYPKIAFVYFVMMVGLLLPWAVEDRRIMGRLMLIALPLFAAVPFSENGTTPVLDYSWGWIAGLALSLIAWYLLYSAFRLTWKKDCFMERDRIENN